MYGSSQARSQIRAVAAGLCHKPEKLGIQAASATYTTAHGNAGSLTHWARPGIKPTSSWMLVRFVSAELWQELPKSLFGFSLFLFFGHACGMWKFPGQGLSLCHSSDNARCLTWWAAGELLGSLFVPSFHLFNPVLLFTALIQITIRLLISWEGLTSL